MATRMARNSGLIGLGGSLGSAGSFCQKNCNLFGSLRPWTHVVALVVLIVVQGGQTSNKNNPVEAAASASNTEAKAKKQPRVCRQCGQHHSHHEPHLYNYVDEVDEDLMCQICLQPFVQPIDTPCGHTFCHVCMHNYLKVNPMCPLDRKPLNEMTCSPSNLVLKR